MELKIENSEGLVLWTGFGDLVQVPMKKNERAQCREVLMDALDLLDQTILKYDTFSTEGERDGSWLQSPQHLSDCLEVCCFPLPSEPQSDTQEPHLRLVSAGLPSPDC